MQTVLDKLTMPEQTMQVLKVVETETCNIAKKQEESKELDGDLPKAESDDVKIELPEGDVLNDSSSTGAELLNKATGTDQIGKSNSGAEKVTLPDLGKENGSASRSVTKICSETRACFISVKSRETRYINSVYEKTWRSN